jgi:hypothetical protein
MSADNKQPTHTAFAFSRQGRKYGRLLECGIGRVDPQSNLVHVFMDRGPIIGYTGYIVLSPIGAAPPKIEPPTSDGDDDDESEQS